VLVHCGPNEGGGKKRYLGNSERAHERSGLGLEVLK